MSRAKHTPNRLPLLTKLVVWLRRLPVRVRAMLRGGTEDDNSARIASDLPHTALAEPSPDFPVPAVEVSDTCKREATSAGEEPVIARESLDESLHVPSPGAAEPSRDAASVVESSEPCERETLNGSPSEGPVTSEESLDVSLHVTDDLPDDSAAPPEPFLDVLAPAAEPGETLRATNEAPHNSGDLPEPQDVTTAEPSDTCERDALSEGEEPDTAEELLDESLHFTKDLPFPDELRDGSLFVANDPSHGSGGLPEPAPNVPAHLAEPSDGRETLSAGEELVSPEELQGESLANDLPHDSEDLPEPFPNVPPRPACGERSIVKRSGEREPPQVRFSPSLRTCPSADQSRLDSDSIISDLREEPATPEALATNDLPHDSEDLSERCPDVPTPAAEACKQDALSTSDDLVTPEELLDESLHVTNDLPHDSASLLEPSPAVSAPAAEPSEACEQDALNASTEPVTPEGLLDKPLQVTNDVAHDSGDHPEQPCEANERIALSVSVEPATPEELLDECLATNELPHDRADLPEPLPVPAPAEREAPGVSAEPINPEELPDESLHLTNDLPHDSGDLRGAAPDVPTLAAEPCEQEGRIRSTDPIIPEALLDESPAADLPHDSEGLPELRPDVTTTTELSHACEQDTPSASEESVTPTELPDECLATNELPHDRTDLPEPFPVPAPAEREALSVSAEPISRPEESPDESFHITNDLPHDSGDFGGAAPDVPTLAAEPCEQEALDRNPEPVIPEALLDECPAAGGDFPEPPADERDALGASVEPATPGELLDESGEAYEQDALSTEPVTPEGLLDKPLHVTNDVAHDSGDHPELPLEPCEANERNALSVSVEPATPGELLDEPLAANDLPHDSADLPDPLPDVPVAAEPGEPREREALISREELPDEPLNLTNDQPHDSADLPAPAAAPGEANQRDDLPHDSGAPDVPTLAAEPCKEALHLATDLPHDSEDLLELRPDVTTPTAEPSQACEQDTLSAGEEPATPEELLDEYLVTNELPHDRADLPEPFPAPAERESPSLSAELITPEELLDECLHATDLPHDGANLPEPPPDVPAPATELSKACEREALIRRRWMETGIKMWNPRIHGTGDVALSIQGRVELLAPAPGETLPRYDKLEFKVSDGQIVCEGVTVEEQHSDHLGGDVAPPTHRES